MSLFPWDSLKAETLRSICKDLEVKLGTKRKQDMVAILKAFETQGLSSKLQDDESTEKVVPAVSKDKAPKPIKKLPRELEGNKETNTSDSEGERKSVGPQTAGAKCPCADGWLSLRMRFILSTVAAVASDLVLDTGEFAIDAGHVGGVHMTQYIPNEELPQGKSVALWLEGYSTLLRVINETFENGGIPTEPALLETLQKSKKDNKLVNAFTKRTEIEHALSGLVKQAKYEWSDDFEDVHCDDESGWNELPTCTKHDFAWTLAEDMLAG